MKKLNLSKTLALPADVITQTIGILAKRGAGKSYTASVLAEEMVAAKLPFCVLDPTGAWWGLRVTGGGKPGLPVVIIGGRHGDIPLEPTAGTLIADLVVDNPGFYVLDLSMFDSNAAQDKFATDFAERLYRRKQQSRSPLHLFVDEADSFAPQRPYHGQERMLGAFEALSRRGRIYGIGVTLISQRAAVINKNVLSQIEVLIALQTTAPHDRDAIEGWAEGHGTKEQVEEMMGSLASLGLGEAWVWSPSWLELFRRVQIRKRDTFNSSATPKVGEVRQQKKLAPVDIAKLREAMAATIERVKTDDPKELRRQIADLKRHKCPVAAPVADEGGMKRALADQERLFAMERNGWKRQERVLLAALEHIGRLVGNTLGRDEQTIVVDAPPIPADIPAPRRQVSPSVVDGPFRPSRSQQAILNTLAWLASINVTQGDKTQVAFLSDQSPTSSTYSNNLGAMRSLKLIDYPTRGMVVAKDVLFIQ